MILLSIAATDPAWHTVSWQVTSDTCWPDYIHID